MRAILTAKHYAASTTRNYTQEMRLLFTHYRQLLPAEITTDHIIAYINYIIKEHGVGRAKCHQAAQSCSFFYKWVHPSAFVVPSRFYPRKVYKLPQIFSRVHIKQLLQVITNPKHRMIISLFYGTGMRLNELRQLRLCDIDSTSCRIKVSFAKVVRIVLRCCQNNYWMT
ncbi:MAG: phage integrase N-terminal SAM-like domain-containing protein [Chitinophagaceae bacterium]|nr:phage integrase N-terminal SAM-like domain-containing protein [Chitinophagaceae bacterium]